MDGFDATTVDRIVTAARMSKTDFYGFFADREAIFIEVASRLRGYQGAQFPLGEGTTRERLYDAALRLRPAQLVPDAIGIFRAAITAMRVSPVLGREVYLSRVKAGRVISNYLHEVGSRRFIPEHDDLLLAIRFGALATDGIRHLAGLPLPDADTCKEFAAQTTDLFLHGHATAAYRSNSTQRCHAPAGLPMRSVSRSSVPPAGKATRLPEERWTEVMRTAWSMFRDCGFDRVSMDAIGERVGLPKNTIYRRYESKSGLFEAACKHVISDIWTEPLSADWIDQSARAALVDVALDLQRRFCEPDMLQLVRMVIARASHDPFGSSAICEHLVRETSTLLAIPLRNLIEAGLLKPVPLEDISWRFFILSTFNTRYLFILPKNEEEMQSDAEVAVDLLLFGVLSDA